MLSTLHKSLALAHRTVGQASAFCFLGRYWLISLGVCVGRHVRGFISVDIGVLVFDNICVVLTLTLLEQCWFLAGYRRSGTGKTNLDDLLLSPSVHRRTASTAPSSKASLCRPSTLLAIRTRPAARSGSFAPS